MPVSVIYVLKMIDIHHQNAKRAVVGLGPLRLAAKLGEEGAPRKQAGQVVVGYQPVNVPLVLAVDLVEKVEPQGIVSDGYLIPVLEHLLNNAFSVEQRAAPRPEIL